MANERHTDAREWEIDSSTRQSVHPYNKYAPFRLALSDTASTLKSVDQGEIATNWVTNPSFEVDTFTTSIAAANRTYILTGSALTQVPTATEASAAGAYSMKVNPGNDGAGEGFYWVTPKIPRSINSQYLTAQIEHKGESAASAVKLEIRSFDPVTGTAVLATSGSSNLAAGWTRATASYVVPANTTAATYRIYMTTVTQHNVSFFVDKFMFEVREDTLAVSTYVDGDVGLNTSWSGTANASTSRKRSDLAVIKGIQIKNESGTSAEIVYVAFDQTATSTYTGTTYIGTGIPVLAGATFETNWPLNFREKVSVISASGTPTVSGVIWGTHSG